MADEKPAAETVDTAAQQTDQGAAPAQAGKEDTGKVDLNRLIEEEGYAEKVLTETPAQPSDAPPEPSQPAGEPSQQAAAATAGQASEQSIIVKDGDVEERIPISQAQNRLSQAKHLQRLWQNEIAPLARVVRDSPILADALQRAMRGDRSKLDAMIVQANAEQGADPQAAEEKRIEALSEKLLTDKRFEGWKKEELKANLSAISAMQAALTGQPTPTQEAVAQTQQDFQATATAIAAESRRLQAELQAADPEYQENRKAVGEIVNEMYEKVKAGQIDEQAFLHTVALYNDPRQKDENGVPLYLKLHQAARQYRLMKQNQGAGAPASVRGSVNARIAPGAARTAGAAPAGGLPSLSGKSREERLALMDSFLGV